MHPLLMYSISCLRNFGPFLPNVNIQYAHSPILASSNISQTGTTLTCSGFVVSPATAQTVRKKSQNFIGRPSLMKNASPSTFVSGVVCNPSRSAFAASTCASAALSAYTYSKYTSLVPICTFAPPSFSLFSRLRIVVLSRVHKGLEPG